MTQPTGCYIHELDRSRSPPTNIKLKEVMINFLLSILDYLGLIDSEARKDGPSTWSRRNRKLIRVVLIVCWIPFCAGLLIFLTIWLSHLGPVAQRVAIGVGVIQLIGLIVLLGRRNRT
jgi:hypothetical protein